MNNRASNFTRLGALILFLSVASYARADLVVTSGISEDEFRDAFTNDRIWYAQLQPGGSGTIHPDNEFDIGGDTNTSFLHDEAWGVADAYYQGNTSTYIPDETNCPFTIRVDSANNLSVSFNDAITPEGSQYAITEPFNTIWVGLYLVTGNGFDNTLEVNAHIFDGTVSLPDMYVEEPPNVYWAAFKFYKDDDLSNIGEITITGNINPDMFFGGAADEDWTYTVFATYNPDLEAEVTPIELGSFTYDHGTGAALLTLQAAPSAAYVLKQSTDPGDFTSATTITPTAVTTGTLDGNQITTDATGKAVIQFNLGTAPRMFVRGERP
jgi:hypothetical protein